MTDTWTQQPARTADEAAAAPLGALAIVPGPYVWERVDGGYRDWQGHMMWPEEIAGDDVILLAPPATGPAGEHELLTAASPLSTVMEEAR